MGRGAPDATVSKLPSVLLVGWRGAAWLFAIIINLAQQSPTLAAPASTIHSLYPTAPDSYSDAPSSIETLDDVDSQRAVIPNAFLGLPA